MENKLNMDDIQNLLGTTDISGFQDTMNSMMDSEDVQETISKMIKEDKCGKTRLTAEYQESQKKQAARGANHRKLEMEAKNMSYKKKLKMKKDHKTVKVGHNCVIISPNGLTKRHIVKEGLEVSFLESKIGNNVLSFRCPDIEVGELAGGNIKVFYSPDKNTKPNKHARILFPEELKDVHGCVAVYSDKIMLKVENINNLIENSKKYFDLN